MGQIDVIIPVKNEADNVRELIERIHKSLTSAEIKYRLIFVDDNSSDKTIYQLKNLSKTYPIIIHSKSGKAGKAFSVIEGAKLAQTEYVAMIDGDLQYPPEALPAMFELTSKDAVVVANRKVHHTSRVRRTVSSLFRHFFGKFLFGMPTDVQSGMKIFKKSLLNHIDSGSVDAWTLDLPLLHTAKQLGLSIGSVDIEFLPRKNGQSKLRIWSASAQIGLRAVKLKLEPPKIFRIDPPSVGSPVGAGVIHKGQHFITHTQISNEHSAVNTFSSWQKTAVLSIISILTVCLFISPLTTAIVFMGILTTIYFVDVFFNLFLISKSLRFPPEFTFSSQKISQIKDSDLPVYSVLCPLYHESRVLPEFLTSIEKLDWPKSKLDVLLLLEENDSQTIEAAQKINLPSFVRVVIVPHSFPKTKPKACNYGLTFARGEYVVIYDAEDRPDPDQLKKAYLGFKNSSEKIVCLQAKLNYYNPGHNLLTRLFTAEYSLWFDVVLPGLQSINTALPLGGTSNHFKIEILRKLHGWDAFNVTEDCDLGARLFKMGYQTAMIDSTTLEEANSRLGNWLRQRSRWIKGYVQTYLVHNRHPLQFLKLHGIHALIFQLVVGGKIAFMLINPLLWLATISYFTLYSIVGPAIDTLFPPVIFYMAVFSLIFGNFLFLYYYMIGCAKRGHWELVKYVYFIPLYWLMVSVAAVKAIIQLIFRPHYWEKTIHGFHLKPEVVAAVAQEVPVKKFYKLPKFTPELASGMFLIISSGLAGVVNLLTNTFLGRRLDLAEFGLISLITSLFTLFRVPLGALSQTVTYRSGFLLGKYQSAIATFWVYVRSRIFLVSLAVTLVWVALIPFLTNYFHANSYIPFIMFTPFIIVSGLSAVDKGYLSGNLKFVILALLGLIDALCRLLFSWIFISLNRPDLVYAAIPISALITFVLGWIAALSLSKKNVIAEEKTINRFPVKFFGSSMLLGISSVAFISLDLILAKHFLSPEAAGQYSLLSLTGKMVYFIGTMFSQFITPVVSRSEGAGQNSQATFYKLLGITTLACIATFAFIGLGGRLTVPLIFGHKVDAVLDLLPWYTLAMAAFTISGSIVNFHQIKKQYIFPVISFVFVILQWIFIILFHKDITSFVSVVYYLSLAQLAILLTAHVFAEKLFIITQNLKDLLGVFTSHYKPVLVSPGKKRILILNWRDTRHKWGGGAEVYLHEAAKRWAQAGHHVVWFCGNDHKCPRQEVLDGIHIIRRGGFFMVYIWAFLYYIFHFHGKFDAVVDSENGIPFFTPLYVKEPKFLLVHHVHQDKIIFQGRLPFPLTQIAMLLESKLMPWVYRHQKIITVSQSSKKDLLKLFPNSDISIINPGIDPAKFITSKKTSDPSFLYLGRIRPYKNLDIAIRAFAKVVVNHPKAIFTIAGWGENIPEFKKLTKELNIEDSVRFLMRVSEEEKIELLAKSWVMVQPSSFEGWGITVIEANASGTPVIASDVIGLRDSVVHQETGLLVPARDVEGFAFAMDYLIAHKARLKNLSTAAITWSKNFNWVVNSERFLSIMTNNYSPQQVTLKPNYLFAEPH